MSSARFFSDSGIKWLIWTKLALVGGAIALATGWVYLGDKPLAAEETAGRNAETKPTAAGGSQTQVAAPGQTSGSAAKADSSSEDEDEFQVVTQRKSFLDDLLYLPKVNTEKMKKDEMGRYLGLVEKKKGQIEDRLKLLEQREAHLKGLEHSLDEKLQKLEEEMAFFQQTLQKEKKLNDERLGNLVEFYQKMEPKKAAPVFEKLDKDLVVALFNRIPRKQVVTILQLMKPEKSVELSEYYGRIRSGNEYEMLHEINTSLRKEFDDCKGMPSSATAQTE